LHVRDKFGKIGRSTLFLQFNPGGGCSLKWILSILGLFAFFLYTALPLGAVAPPTNNSAAFNDGIDRTDPNFVKASLLIMSPGDALYSCAGHTCIRLECPKFNLDFCFSYESEGVTDKIFTFFMGKLKMGMFAIPTADYLKIGCDEGRGVMQYRLNLPPDAKQRLWKILDERVAQGAYLPYDYLKRGCAQSVLQVILEALRPYQLVVSQWPGKYKTLSRRELGDKATENYPWQQVILYAICGTGLDSETSMFGKVVIPEDLLEVLRLATINGKPVIDKGGKELLPAKIQEDPPAFTPLMASGLVVLFAIVNFFLKSTAMDVTFLAFQSVLGLFVSWLLIVSNLPATSWNWLIVPFNLLPLVLWKWRQKWALWFAGLLVLWEIGMMVYPHRLTDPAYLVLVVAYIVMYARIGWHGRARRPATAVHPVTRSCADIFENLRRRNMERGRV
jgi:hypothetical protein